MSLIKSISGIRGTIGGQPGEGLSPIDIVKFTAAYATFIRKTTTRDTNTIVVGRDARLSGRMVNDLVIGTLTGMGFDVVNIGPASTPTTEIAVVEEQACGGIIITASHNPIQWNALKLLNQDGEFLNDMQGKEVLRIADEQSFTFADVMELGHEYTVNNYNQRHIRKVLDLELVDREAIAKADFTVAVDAVNSVGGVVIPQLLRALGVRNIVELNCDPSGRFAHTPEPIPANLTQIAAYASRRHRCRLRGRPRCRPSGHRDGKRRDVCRGIYTCRRGRLCVKPHPRLDRQQPQFVTRLTRHHQCPRMHI